jgi:hypothetical protein
MPSRARHGLAGCAQDRLGIPAGGPGRAKAVWCRFDTWAPTSRTRGGPALASESRKRTGTSPGQAMAPVLDADYPRIPIHDLPFGLPAWFGEDSWGRTARPRHNNSVERPAGDQLHALVWTCPAISLRAPIARTGSRSYPPACPRHRLRRLRRPLGSQAVGASSAGCATEGNRAAYSVSIRDAHRAAVVPLKGPAPHRPHRLGVQTFER